MKTQFASPTSWRASSVACRRRTSVGERLIGRATLEGRERRKLFVNATLTSSVTGTELAKASGIAIAVEMRNLRDRGEI